MNPANPTRKSWILTIGLMGALAIGWVIGAFLLAFLRPVGAIPRSQPAMADYGSDLAMLVQPLSDEVIGAALADFDLDKQVGGAFEILPSSTLTPSATSTSTPTPTSSPTLTATPSPSSTATSTASATPAVTPSRTWIPITNTPGPSPTATLTQDAPRPSATNPGYPPPPTTVVPRPTNTPPAAYP